MSGDNYCPNCGWYLKEIEFGVKVKPTISQDYIGHHEGDTVETHPSYAQLSFSRVNCSKSDNNTLYGSAIRHQSIITMRIAPSKKHVSNYSESYFAENHPYIEIQMSQAQFAEAITTLNVGSGVPVTLKSMMGKWYPDCQELTVQERTQQNLNKQLKQFANKLKEYKARTEEILTKKGTITASEKMELKGTLSGFLTDIQSNLPFLNECMQEALDKNVSAAKSDVESFLMHSITMLGIDALQNSNNQIIFNNDDIKQIE
jgi:ElaB/YqjD/DUF883 family membrane-anchored ribosome-binding protein